MNLNERLHYLLKGIERIIFEGVVNYNYPIEERSFKYNYVHGLMQTPWQTQFKEIVKNA